MYDMMTIVDTVLEYAGKLLREQIPREFFFFLLYLQETVDVS